LVFIRLLTLIR